MNQNRDEAAVAMCELLGLAPSTVTDIHLEMKPGSLPKIIATVYPDESKLKALFKTYSVTLMEEHVDMVNVTPFGATAEQFVPSNGNKAELTHDNA